MRPVQIKRHEFDDSDAADNFGGIYFSTTFIPKQTTDFYVFYRDKDDNQPDLDPTNGEFCKERGNEPPRSHWLIITLKSETRRFVLGLGLRR